MILKMILKGIIQKIKIRRCIQLNRSLWSQIMKEKLLKQTEKTWRSKATGQIRTKSNLNSGSNSQWKLIDKFSNIILAFKYWGIMRKIASMAVWKYAGIYRGTIDKIQISISNQSWMCLRPGMFWATLGLEKL